MALVGVAFFILSRTDETLLIPVCKRSRAYSVKALLALPDCISQARLNASSSLKNQVHPNKELEAAILDILYLETV